jgi:serine/threonine protein kinase
VLAGKYRVDRVLGSGGMGMVVAAKHVELHELVAVKFLRAGISNADVVARFEREARAAAKIKGDHVARVTDLGRLENGSPYMVMEYLEGEDLGARLEKRGPLPIDQAIDFVAQACEAIAEAHGLGIVHRDLKPSNLFVVPCPDGSERIKVLDFGIAKISEPIAPGLDVGMTGTLAVMGSPYYMSPEQLKSSRNVDGRTDVWALGVILYELLTGKMPFDGEELPDLYMKITRGAPPPIDRAEVPQDLQNVVMRCLEKARDERYQNLTELTSALAKFGSSRAAESAERVSKISRAARVSSLKRTMTTGPDRRTIAVLVAATALLAALAVIRAANPSSSEAKSQEASHAPPVVSGPLR